MNNLKKLGLASLLSISLTSCATLRENHYDVDSFKYMPNQEGVVHVESANKKIYVKFIKPTDSVSGLKKNYVPRSMYFRNK